MAINHYRIAPGETPMKNAGFRLAVIIAIILGLALGAYTTGDLDLQTFIKFLKFYLFLN